MWLILPALATAGCCWKKMKINKYRDLATEIEKTIQKAVLLEWARILTRTLKRAEIYLVATCYKIKFLVITSNHYCEVV